MFDGVLDLDDVVEILTPEGFWVPVSEIGLGPDGENVWCRFDADAPGVYRMYPFKAILGWAIAEKDREEETDGE